jgi:hypothetical protein
VTVSLLRVYVPGADWLARCWADYLEGADTRRRRLESEAAERRFEAWLDDQFCAGRDLTAALRSADQAVKLDCLRACRCGVTVGNRYISAFGEIDLDRAFL